MLWFCAACDATNVLHDSCSELTWSIVRLYPTLCSEHVPGGLMFGIEISCESCCGFARPMMQQMFCMTRIVNLRDPFCDFTQPMFVFVRGELLFGIKILCASCSAFARPMMQQMFCVTRIMNLRDPFFDFTQSMLRTCAR